MADRTTFNLDEARYRFKLATDAWSKQRQREREDTRFQVPELQWTEDARTERSGDGGKYPPRPMLSVDLLKQPRQLVKNQFTRARLGVNLRPVSEEADEELAEIKQGIYRRIERDGMADQARGWAFDRATLCGLGWYRIVKRYDEDADPSGPGAWDQEIAFDTILYQDNVYVDPAAQKPDFSDARFFFLVSWLTQDEVRARWPRASLARSTDAFDWNAAETLAPDWVRVGGERERSLLVAEYWWKRVQRQEITGPGGQKRYREKPTVFCTHMLGTEELETYQWDGKYFPFIPIVGEVLQPVDGERRWQGMVRPARDGQRFANFAASSLVEGMSLEPKAPWVMAEGQDEGWEDEWQQSNRRNLPVLHYKPTTLGDKTTLIPPPARAQVDSSRMTLAMMAWQEARGFVQAATAVHEPSLGEMSKRKDAQSGRAILALQQQADAGTSQFMDNVRQITLPYEALVILDLIPHVYDRDGRVLSIVTGEDEAATERIMLGEPFVTDQRGVPVAAPKDPKARTIKLSQGGYGIDIDIGRAFQTRLQEGGEMLGEILAKAPALIELIGPTYFEFQDWPGAKEVAEILRKVRDMKYPGLASGDDQESPEALKARLMAAEAQAQQAGQALQQASQALQTDQAKQAAQVEVARIKAETEVTIARMKHAADITVARIKAEQQAVSDETEAKEELLATGIKIEAEREARHDEFAHELGKMAADASTVRVKQSVGSDNEREEGREMSSGDTSERSQEDQPPQVGGEA
jgi:hypothetical protein